MGNEITWRFIDSGPCDAAYNMALDEAIAFAVRKGRTLPTLRVYGWEVPSVSIGSFQGIPDINREYCAGSNIPVVRRPTGGRAILHGDELTYGFSSGNEGPFSKGLLETYRLISTALQSGLEMAGVRAVIKREREPGRNLTRSPLCFQSTSYGEISFDRKKLIGSAQKRWPDGFLQQGSIPYSLDYEKLLEVFNLKDSDASCVKSDEFENKDPFLSFDSLRITHHASLPLNMVGLRELIRDFDPEKFKRCIRLSFERVFGVTLADALPSPQEAEFARSLVSEKYRNPLWTEGEVQRSRSCSNNGRLRQA